MYIHIKTESMQETMAYLGKKYNGPVTAMEIVKKEDLVSLSVYLIENQISMIYLIMTLK